jgi:hypothetical protein
LDLALRAAHISRRQGAWAHVWNALIYTADALAGLHSSEIATQLLAGVRRSSVALIPRVARLADRLEARLTDGLGPARFVELVYLGERLTAPQAAALADVEAVRFLKTTEPD